MRGFRPNRLRGQEQESPSDRRVRLHDLRHTYASRLLERGIPIEDVSRLLGHASVTTTMRYAHRAKSRWDSVRAALD
ncbi:tyrosine-type recombinase/integrase [Nocardia sp. NPDC057455]|uniref:tyrosine-type recombinase/integrase n=1 Tax=Nocardia sp. NPDC057455 TaxID=3346138 RepID=UPI00366EE7AA